MNPSLMQVMFYLDNGIDMSINVLAFDGEEAIGKAASYLASELGVDDHMLLDCKTVDVAVLNTHVDVWNDRL